MHKFCKLLLSALVISYSGIASAEVTDITIPFASTHRFVNDNKHYNQKNYGVGILGRFTPDEDFKWVGYELGIFKNSYSKEALFGAVTVTYINTNKVRIGTEYGLISGYEYPVMGSLFVNVGDRNSIYLKFNTLGKAIGASLVIPTH